MHNTNKVALPTTNNSNNNDNNTNNNNNNKGGSFSTFWKDVDLDTHPKC